MQRVKVFTVFILTVIFFSLFWFSFLQQEDRIKQKELQSLETSPSFDDLARKVTKIATDKGSLYAYQLVLDANLPSGTDLHLLGHAIGDVLYKQEGKEGLGFCTDDFRNACAHSIVIGMFMDSGTEAISEINEVCKKAPGGKGAYLMCFHGLGHGVLAFAGYNLEAAVDLCKKTGTKKHLFAESAECISGAIMEMVSGVHDVDVWMAQKDKYFKKSDPLYPCTAGFIPPEAKYQCIQYLTPHIMESVGIDMSNPQPELYKKAFEVCNTAEVDTSLKISCYSGFGKEFVGIAAGRDIQNLDNIKDEALVKVVEWCNFSGSDLSFSSCIKEVVNSLYWGGENSYLSSVRFCRLIGVDKNKSECFEHLLGAVKYYKGEKEYMNRFCAEILNDNLDCK